jgi:hypothetical protein
MSLTRVMGGAIALVLALLLAEVAPAPMALAQSTQCSTIYDSGLANTACVSAPPIDDGSHCSAQPTIIDQSPTVKLEVFCGGMAVLCGTYTDIDGKQWHGPKPCDPPPPPMPDPQVSPSDRYSTSNGTRSASDIQAELLRAGYAGPFDVPSLLAAYQRATNSPVRPL